HLLIIEQGQAFSCPSPLDGQFAFKLVQIKDVRGTPQFEHHVVGDVNQHRHRSLTTAQQAACHPVGGGSPCIDTANHPPRKTPAQIGGLDVHRQRLHNGRHDGCHVGQ